MKSDDTVWFLFYILLGRKPIVIFSLPYYKGSFLILYVLGQRDRNKLWALEVCLTSLRVQNKYWWGFHFLWVLASTEKHERSRNVRHLRKKSKVLPAQRNFLLIFYLLLADLNTSKKNFLVRILLLSHSVNGNNKNLQQPLNQPFPGSIAASHLWSQHQERV